MSESSLSNQTTQAAKQQSSKERQLQLQQQQSKELQKQQPEIPSSQSDDIPPFSSESKGYCACPSNIATSNANVPGCTSNFVTIPVPILQNEGIYAYVAVKGSLHDYTSTVFGLNQTEVQALTTRYENGIKQIVNGILVGVTPIEIINTLAQLGYKVVSSSGEGEICWTMQREA